MKNVFINEDLTRAKQEILYHARKLKKDKIIANTWTKDGQVYIKVDQQDGPTEVKYIMANLKKILEKYIVPEITMAKTQYGPKTSSEIDISKMAKSVLDFTFNNSTSTPPPYKRK